MDIDAHVPEILTLQRLLKLPNLKMARVRGIPSAADYDLVVKFVAASRATLVFYSGGEDLERQQRFLQYVSKTSVCDRISILR